MTVVHERMSLLGYLRIVRDHWRVVLAVLFVVVAGVGAWTATAPRSYTAQAAVAVAVDVAGAPRDLRRGFAYASGVSRVSVGLATSPVVLDPVIRRLGLTTTAAELAGRVTARAPQDTVLVRLSAAAENPQAATALVNAIAEQLVIATDQVTRPSAGLSAVRTVFAAPASGETAKTPDVTLTMTLAVVLGALAAVIAAITRAEFPGWVAGRAGIVRVTDTPVFGTPPVFGTSPGRTRRGWARRSRGGADDELIDQVRARLLHLRQFEGVRTVLLAAADDAAAGVGVVAGLSSSLGAPDRSVLVIDGDLRGGALSRRLGVPDEQGGLAGVLAGTRTWQRELRLAPARAGAPASAALTVLPAGGPTPRDPAATLALPIMAELLAHAARRFDTILIYTPPIGVRADGLALADRVDAVLVLSGASAGPAPSRRCTPGSPPR